MGRRYSTGFFGGVEEENVRLQKISVERNSSDVSRLFLNIYKFSFHEERDVDRDILLTTVKLIEEQGRRRHIDVYFFDTEGELLDHNFLIYRENPGGIEIVTDETHDKSTKRLKTYCEDIKEMLGRVLLPANLAEDATVRRLINNQIEK